MQAILSRTMDHVKWGARVEWIRDAYAGGSDAEMARRLQAAGLPKVQRQHIQNWRGGQGVTLEYVEVFVRAFPRISPEWLLTGRGPRERPPDAEDPRIETARSIRDRLMALTRDIDAEFGLATGDGAVADVEDVTRRRRPGDGDADERSA